MKSSLTLNAYFLVHYNYGDGIGSTKPKKHPEWAFQTKKGPLHLKKYNSPIFRGHAVNNCYTRIIAYMCHAVKLISCRIQQFLRYYRLHIHKWTCNRITKPGSRDISDQNYTRVIMSKNLRITLFDHAGHTISVTFCYWAEDNAPAHTLEQDKCFTYLANNASSMVSWNATPFPRQLAMIEQMAYYFHKAISVPIIRKDCIENSKAR